MMELELKLSSNNTFPLGALLIKGDKVETWLQELQRSGLQLSAIKAYPLPGTVANTVWGCLAIAHVERSATDVGRANFCQQVHSLLFIPERAIIQPQLSAEELAKLLHGALHFFHPEIGLVELTEAVDWKVLLQSPSQIKFNLKKPAPAPRFPHRIKSFQVKQSSTQETLAALEQTHFPKAQSFSDKALNPFEKAKLFLFQQLFKKGEANGSGNGGFEKPQWIDRLFPKRISQWMDGLQQDLEELERRNQKHLDRLMDLLKKDPLEALKYALPLDEGNTGRGGFGGQFNLEKRWFDFSLFGNLSGGSGPSTVMSGDTYWQLHQQYTETAKHLIAQKEYRKAAFVYMKLLKNYFSAAQTLEEGKLYAEAAAIYLRYCDNKTKAAECFEKAAQYNAAIELNKELGNDEKVGDLYLRTARKKEALYYYQKVVDSYDANHRYLKASLVAKDKMNDEDTAQLLLLKGWRTNHDGFNCLNNYFANHHNTKALSEAIQAIYSNDVTAANREVFLRVLQYEYKKNNELAQLVRDMAYEVIAAGALSNPGIVSELRLFNNADNQLPKDTMRFKLNRRQTN